VTISPRRTSCIVIAVAAVAGPGRLLATRAAEPIARASAAAANEAGLDFAADVGGGPWCTAPLPEAARTVRSLEGWVRLKGHGPGVLLEIGGPAGRTALRLAVTEEPALVVGGAGRPPAADALRLARDTWTHFQLDAAREGLRLSAFDATTGRRTSAVPGPAGAAIEPGMRLCVGGTTSGEGGLAAWVDELRVWSAELPADVAAAWRDRRVSAAHPLWPALLADWPFRSGQGLSERGQGPLGELSAKQARWIDLPRLAYGPVLGEVTARSAHFLFAAQEGGGADAAWTADVAMRPAAGGPWRTSGAPTSVGDATDFVAHFRRDGLEPQTAYRYVPMIDGRAAAAGPEDSLPLLATAPDLAGANADFSAVFLADQHTAETPEPPSLEVYAAAAAVRPVFWAQLGDIVPGSTDGRTPEHKRDRGMLRGLWRRNFAPWTSPQARLLRTVPLGFATISDHEITNNYDLNWHHHDYGPATSRQGATLGDRIRQYDLSLARWWNHLGRAAERADDLSRAAAQDFGRAAMGQAYATPGVYRAVRPYPFVEFLVLDTTSYRGDAYQFRDRYDHAANRDTDHARYAWDAGRGAFYIYGDRGHGGNEVTDRVRSWLGPTQKAAFLAALRDSTAKVVVVAAGYPLYSYKFEDDPRYWEGRESGFDFATEVEEIVAALERLDRLVLWVHGDGHTPALVKLRKNLYQLQVGPTLLASGGTGHRSRTLGSGSRSPSDLIGGGLLIATHQPDLSPGLPSNDVFRGGLDTFEGFLRLYFHPGQEALRRSEEAGARRAAAGDAVEVPATVDPARNDAGRLVVGSVARLRFGDLTVHGVIRSYRFEAGRAVFRFDPGLVRADPDEFRVLIDGVPWVEARWFDAGGREWRDLAAVLRREP
jgi:hypothetical protein